MMYEEIFGNYENEDSPYIWAIGLGKISSSSSYLGGGGAWFAISSFRDTPEKRHGTCQNVEEKKFIFQGFEMQLKK